MRAKRRLPLFFLAALVLCGPTACNRERSAQAAREDRSQTVPPPEQDFLMKAAQANLTEINVARIAIQKSDSLDVREFANMVQRDHTVASADLSDVMSDRNLAPPKTPPQETVVDIARMNGLTGPEFDREFMNLMVSDHQKAVELFRDESAAGPNQDVKRYVEELLPKLEMHLEKAQRLQSRLFSALK